MKPSEDVTSARRSRDVPPQVRLESRDCPLCGGSGTGFVLSGFDRLHDLPGTFTIVRCTGCGLMRTNPRPTSDTIAFYYPDEYGPYQYTRVERDQAPPPARPGWKRALRDFMDTRSSVLPDLPPGRMLEIGCASGGFLALMQQKGWSAEGVEFSPTAAESARRAGLTVFSGSIDDAPLADHGYDLIVAWMVLEHLHDPVAALRRLRAAVKPGGFLAFSVPNAASIDFHLGNAGYALQLPTHLFHFTPRTMRKALEATGWRIERLLHQRTASNLVATIGNAITDRRSGSKLGTALKTFPERAGRAHDVLFPLAFLLSLAGQTGRMTIWARPA